MLACRDRLEERSHRISTECPRCAFQGSFGAYGLTGEASSPRVTQCLKTVTKTFRWQLLVQKNMLNSIVKSVSKSALALFVLVNLVRVLSCILSFRVHVKLCYRIVSYRLKVMQYEGHGAFRSWRHIYLLPMLYPRYCEITAFLRDFGVNKIAKPPHNKKLQSREKSERAV